MNHLSLFSGIAGIDLAAEKAGFKTIAFCEKDSFCHQLLNKRFPGVPIFDDIYTLTTKSLVSRGIKPDSIKLITGGYPCQPDSKQGKLLGKEDDRYLWPEMFRVVQEIRPDWILGENVANHINMGLDGVLSDLESADYETRAFVIPACAVGAHHVRERVFVVAHSQRRELPGREVQGKCPETWPESEQQLSGLLPPDFQLEIPRPELYGNTNGVSRKLDAARLKALGNAVMPQVVYPILKAIADYELAQESAR
jgi:DNA (cytosine-5)-methyltransferase 1